MSKVLALTKDGKITFCEHTPEERANGLCNHIFLESELEKEDKQGEENNVIKIDISSDFENQIKNLALKDKVSLIKNGEYLSYFINDDDKDVRIAVANEKYGLDRLVKDKSPFVRKVVAEQGYGLDELLNDSSDLVREEIAKQGYGLDKLVNDPSYSVRCTVASIGYGLDKLINDKEWVVRLSVANQKYGLDKLVNDEEWLVREAVAKQGYGLDKLIKDKCSNVRYAVAMQGYGLDKLINDNDDFVRSGCHLFLEDHGIKNINEYKEILFKNNGDYSVFLNMEKVTIKEILDIIKLDI